LKTFINWCKKKRYINNEIVIRELKEDERPVRSLNDVEIKRLLTAADPCPPIKTRILLALGAGLRRGDIDSLKITDIAFERNAIETTSRKTKKSMASRPVSAEIMAELSKYVCNLKDGQEKLFRTKFNHRKWRKTCKDAGLADLKFHGPLKDILFIACSEWSFNCGDAKTSGTLNAKSYEQSLHKYRPCASPIC